MLKLVALPNWRPQIPSLIGGVRQEPSGFSANRAVELLPPVGRPQQFGAADCGEYRHAAAAARVLLAGA